MKNLKPVIAVISVCTALFLGLGFVAPILTGQKAFKMDAGSMQPTIAIGESVIANLKSYKTAAPTLGDIIVFRYPTNDVNHRYYGKMYIKRVVALPSQVVEIKNKELFVDGAKIVEPYKQNSDNNIIKGLVLPPADFESKWLTGGELDTKSLRDNFGPVHVPLGCVFLLGDNRDSSFDSRYFGPVSFDNIVGKVTHRRKGFGRVAI